MDNERYKVWLHRRVEKSDQSLARLGLTKNSEPGQRNVLEAVRLNRVYHAALDYDVMEWRYMDRISDCMEYLEGLVQKGQFSVAAYDKAVRLLKGVDNRGK